MRLADYNTVLGHLEAVDPEAFALIDDLDASRLQDEAILNEISNQRNIPVASTDAGVRLYRNDLLLEVIGA